MKNKKFLFFGFFDKGYSRNRVLIKGAERLGHNVILCGIDPKKYGTFSKYIALYKEYRKIRSEEFDYIIVAFPGHNVVWLAFLLFGRNIIFDMFVSLYNSEIEDRKSAHPLSLKAFYYWFLDWYSVLLPKTVLLETQTHIRFLSKRFSSLKKKALCVYVGSDDEAVYPKEEVGNDKFIVHFHGTGIPLQGITYIIDAAKELQQEKQVVFHIYGNNGKGVYKEAEEKVKEAGLSNVIFFERFSYEDMSSVLAKADVVLGIFGVTTKAQNVIPNKVFEGWAAQKPVITADTPAIREVFDDKNVTLCAPADGFGLARKIMFLYSNQEKRYFCAKSGYTMYKKRFTPEHIFKKFLEDIKKYYL